MEDYETQLNEDTTRVNQILTELRDLNLQIRNSDVRGDAALELRDQRNLLLDELSGYMKIDVTYSMVNAGGGYMVEEMSVKLADKNNPETFLVKGEYAAQISTSGDNYDVTVSELTNKDGDLHPTEQNEQVVSVFFVSSIVNSPQPETQHVPIPRATTAAWLVIPPRIVKIPSEWFIPSISSGLVSKRTKMTFSPLLLAAIASSAVK